MIPEWAGARLLEIVCEGVEIPNHWLPGLAALLTFTQTEDFLTIHWEYTGEEVNYDWDGDATGLEAVLRIAGESFAQTLQYEIERFGALTAPKGV